MTSFDDKVPPSQADADEMKKLLETKKIGNIRQVSTKCRTMADREKSKKNNELEESIGAGGFLDSAGILEYAGSEVLVKPGVPVNVVLALTRETEIRDRGDQYTSP